MNIKNIYARFKKAFGKGTEEIVDENLGKVVTINEKKCTYSGCIEKAKGKCSHCDKDLCKVHLYALPFKHSCLNYPLNCKKSGCKKDYSRICKYCKSCYCELHTIPAEKHKCPVATNPHHQPTSESLRYV